MSPIALCLMMGVAMALDAATSLRQGMGPYALYNFMDFDSSGNVGSAADLSSHPQIQFGNLTLGPRASWLLGRPGVRVVRETGAGVTAGLTSVNNFQTSWAATFNSTPFVYEMWFQYTTTGTGSFWTLARPNTAAGTAPVLCDVTEPMFSVGSQSTTVLVKCSLYDSTNPCYYSSFTPTYGPKPATVTVALYGRYFANPSERLESVGYQGNTRYPTTPAETSSRSGLIWTDTQARLLFSSSTNANSLSFNLLSFALYPNISDSQIQSLFDAGLPNAKPFAPSFGRSVPENVGGSIRLCPNNPATPWDSDCLDYSNNATHLGLNQTHSLVPSSALEVWITSLPSVGVLWHKGSAITTVPVKLDSANNTVFYAPPTDFTGWYAKWISSAYVFVKDGIVPSFTYYVVDSDGVQSNTANVTLNVFPTHNPPVANTVNATVHAGLPLTPTGLNNVIPLSVTNNEFIAPAVNAATCTLNNNTSPLCSALADHPNPMNTVVTIKTLPAVGTLKVKDWITGAYTTATVNQAVYANKTWCGQLDCVPSYWAIFWEAPLSAFNSSSEILATANFTYTATDYFDLTTALGNTASNVDAVGTPTSVNWASNQTTNVATAYIEVRNGFYARSDTSFVKQKNLTAIEPQKIQLFAEDLTVPSPNMTLFIASLPAKGGLFDSNNAQITSVPPTGVPIPASANFTVGYQPSLLTENFGLESGPNYASFQFFAVSNGVKSNVATKFISVIDTNDPVSIEWYGPTNADGELSFSSPSDPIPQSWSDVPDNNLYFNFTDPDVNATGEPWYNLKLDTINNDFGIFTNPAYYDELQTLRTASIGPLALGFIVSPGVASKSSNSWQITANRTLIQKFLNPIRLRPNRPTGSTLTISITDCQKIASGPYQTSSQFSSETDWAPLTVTKSIVIRGVIVKPPEYEGVANQTILAVVYGVSAFLGVVLLICVIAGIRCCLRRRRAGGGGGGSTKSTSGGSTSKKGGKKAKSAYLHTVEL